MVAAIAMVILPHAACCMVQYGPHTSECVALAARCAYLVYVCICIYVCMYMQ